MRNRLGKTVLALLPFCLLACDVYVNDRPRTAAPRPAPPGPPVPGAPPGYPAAPGYPPPTYAQPGAPQAYPPGYAPPGYAPPGAVPPSYPPPPIQPAGPAAPPAAPMATIPGMPPGFPPGFPLPSAFPTAPAPAPAPSAAPTVASRGGPIRYKPSGGTMNRMRAARALRPAPSANTAARRNPRYFASVRARPESSCGVQEVAPDAFARIDCARYQPVTLAQVFPREVFDRKLGLFRDGKLRLDAPNFASIMSGGGGAVNSTKAGPADAPANPFGLPFALPFPTPGAPAPVPNGGGAQPAPSGNPITVDDWTQLWPKSNDGKQIVAPGDVDHRRDGTEGPIKDQEAVGACTAFSFSTTMDNAIRRLNRSETTSPMHVWSHYGKPSMTAAGDRNLNKPITTNENWAYDPALACRLYAGGDADCGQEYGVIEGSATNDPAVRTKIADSDAKGVFRVSSITRMPLDADTLAQTLATGQSVWAAFCIEKWSAKYIKDGVIADWSDNCSGHAIELAGYRTTSTGRQFLVHNSWGPKWGSAGYAYVSEAMVKRHLEYAYTIKVEPQSGPVAAHTDELTDDDCGWNEVVDGVSGKCMRMCADSIFRPINGNCGW